MPAAKAKNLSSPQTAEELLGFYDDLVTYYHKWAMQHRLIYWVLLLASLACGIGIAVAMFLEAGAGVIAGFALALSCLLLINTTLKPDRKYPRYRMVEIKLKFEMQEMRHNVVRRIKQGEEADSALLAELEVLHSKVEPMVLEEFDEFFRDFTSVKDLHGQLTNVGKPK